MKWRLERKGWQPLCKRKGGRAKGDSHTWTGERVTATPREGNTTAGHTLTAQDKGAVKPPNNKSNPYNHPS